MQNNNLYEVMIRKENRDSIGFYDGKTFEEAGKKAESEGFAVRGVRIIPQIKSSVRIFKWK